MAVFGPKPSVNTIAKMSIFRLFELLLFIVQNGVFSLQNIVKDIFLAYIAENKNVEKMAIFGPERWVIPFGKMSIFRLFFFLQPRNAFFRSRISEKTFSWPILRKKKKFKNWQFLDQNHGLTPLEKCQFFDFLNSVFLQPRKAFFRSRLW